MNRSFRILLLITVAVALAQAAIPADREQQNHNVVTNSLDVDHQTSRHGYDSHVTDVPCSATISAHSHVTVQGEDDHIALAEMHSHVLHHFGTIAVRPETFGVARDWARDWELRWIDYETADHVIRVYHATSKHDREQRFISLWDGSNHEWHSAH